MSPKSKIFVEEPNFTFDSIFYFSPNNCIVKFYFSMITFPCQLKRINQPKNKL